MSLVGLDLNATRLRGVASDGQQAPVRLALEREAVEFPLTLNLEGRTVLAGSAGHKLIRMRPHLACADFLPHLGSTRCWSGPKLRVTAEQALQHCLQALGRRLNRVTSLGLCVPAYLSDAQIHKIQEIFHGVRLPLVGVMRSTLAALLAEWLPDPSAVTQTPVLVVDVDGHALTWSLIDQQGGRPILLQQQISAALGRMGWVRRLLDGVAGRFIRQSRHDPRESGETEQVLYEQVCQFLVPGSLPSFLPVGVQTSHWSCHLMLPAEDLVAFCGPCLRQAALELDSLLGEAQTFGGVRRAILTASAAALPGLADLIRSRLQPPASSDEGDYGDAILRSLQADGVVSLSEDALALAACELAKRIHAGQLPRGYHESLGLVATPHLPSDTGPPRLQFRGNDHLLDKQSFLLGRDPACDLVFETELYPHVSARHAEIVFDRRHYLIYDRSRHGTLVNDQAIDRQAPLHSGDWIRLGPHGPVLRFLGVPQANNRPGG